MQQQGAQALPGIRIGPHQLQAPQPQRHDLQAEQLAVTREAREPQADRGRVARSLAADALVVVDQVAAAVDDELAAPDLGRARMVG